jgi:hypothetical protein
MRERFIHTLIHTLSLNIYMFLAHILTNFSILKCIYTHVLYIFSSKKFKLMSHKIKNKKALVLHFILNLKVLKKQSFSIHFPLASSFMRISFHFFCKVGTTNMNIFFARYLHVIYLHYKYIDTPRITC